MQIDFDGPVGDFVTRLVAQLDEYGEVQPGKPALIALLETVREHVGVDRQGRIDALCAALQYGGDTWRESRPQRRVYTDAHHKRGAASWQRLVEHVVARLDNGFSIEELLEFRDEYPEERDTISFIAVTKMAKDNQSLHRRIDDIEQRMDKIWWLMVVVLFGSPLMFGGIALALLSFYMR